jgi:hypothetical protein
LSSYLFLNFVVSFSAVVSHIQAVLASGDILVYEAFPFAVSRGPSPGQAYQPQGDDRLTVRFRRLAHNVLFHHVREYGWWLHYYFFF